MKRSVLAFVALSVLLFSCSVHETRGVPETTGMPDAFTGEGISEEVVGGQWWLSFGDERLNALMQEAFDGNLGIEQAYRRLEQASAAARSAGAPLSPSLDIKGSAGRARQAGPSGAVTMNNFSLSAAASYELDVWKKLSLRSQAAGLDAEAARSDLEALYLSLSAEVADLYYLALEQREQLELSDRTVAAFEETLDSVRRRYREGLVPALDLYQSRQNLSFARSQRPLFESRLQETLNALSVLLGRFPDQGLLAEKGELPPAPVIPAGLPSEVLVRRPDVRAAALRLQAGDRRAAAAVAERFPSFSLVGAYGGTSDELGRVLDSPNIFWNLLLNVIQPVTDGGRRKAEAERAEAVYQEALAGYRLVVLNAFRDVTDALARGAATSERLDALENRVADAESARRLAVDRYLQGLSDYVPVLTAQQQYYDARSTLISARRQLLSDRIGLARALGGEWPEGKVRERVAGLDIIEGEE